VRALEADAPIPVIPAPLHRTPLASAFLYARPVPTPQETEQERNHDTMTARALREIMIRIRELDFEPGRAFTENELAEELGLGKTPVREALLVLGAQGFVVPRPRSGYRVSPITVKDARDNLAVLRALSAEAAAAAAGRGVDGTTLLMLSDLDEDITPATVDDVRDIVVARTKFFGVLGMEAANQRLLLIVNQMLNHFARLLYLTIRGGTLRRLPAGQADVVDALRSGDADAAAAAARRLVDSWERVLVDAMLQSDTVLSVNVAAVPIEPVHSRSGREASQPAPVKGATAKKPAVPKKPRGQNATAKRTTAKGATAKKAAGGTAKRRRPSS
jgi:DNA-binding GntR family transcriptional regulator